jgi:hypothetical protein
VSGAAVIVLFSVLWTRDRDHDHGIAFGSGVATLGLPIPITYAPPHRRESHPHSCWLASLLTNVWMNLIGQRGGQRVEPAVANSWLTPIPVTCAPSRTGGEAVTERLILLFVSSPSLAVESPVRVAARRPGSRLAASS